MALLEMDDKLKKKMQFVTREDFESAVSQIDDNFKNMMELITKLSIPKYNTLETRFGDIQFAVTGEKDQFDVLTKYMNDMSDRIIKLVKSKSLKNMELETTEKQVKFDGKGYN